ncbi:MAG: hypothetical protein AB1791_00755 [Chloroflexota bacterium]
MPDTSKTTDAARKAGSEIVQMSMQFWPQELARRLNTQLGYKAEILGIPEEDLSEYLSLKIAPIPILDFLGSGLDKRDKQMGVFVEDD